MHTQTTQVQFTQDNVMKCQCDKCPVQQDSSCAMDKMRNVDQMMQGGGGGGYGSPGPGAMQGSMQGQQGGMSQQDIPKVYCSQGTASCNDLDYNQNCICPTCDVWKENDLSNYKYCRDGDASKIG